MVATVSLTTLVTFPAALLHMDHSPAAPNCARRVDVDRGVGMQSPVWAQVREKHVEAPLKLLWPINAAQLQGGGMDCVGG